ncbi:MAG: histidine--tRNA ligase [Acidobacteria bacterium]|nr:histidine--tRNA ligase [Acidobacteriota bacterium]
MTDKQSTKPPSGTRDFLPDDIRRREYVINIVRRVYERYGFEPLETPAFENIETLLGKYGEESNKLIFKILKRGEHEGTGEADLALRYDLTVPLARVVTQYQNELPKFFKRHQIQPVWRADRPARGRFREFWQCDIDSIGSTSPVVEVEILSAVSEVLTGLGFQDFVIRLNHRMLLSALLEVSGLPPAKHSQALVSLDKLDKAGREVVIAEMVGVGIGSSAASELLALFMGAPKIGMFLGRDVPACGFSLGLERIIVVMTERNMFPATVAGRAVDVLVTIWNEESRGDTLALAAELRKGGLRVDVYPEADKLGKQFKYASDRHVRFVAIIGDDERAKAQVSVKDLESGEQTALPRNEVASFVGRKLELRS